MATGEDNVKTIEYRLDKIDTQLEDLKTLMVNSRLQAKDIETINTRIDRLEREQKEIREKIELQEQKLEEVAQAPMKKSASRWNYILDYVFKGLVGAAVLYFFVKTGIEQ